jgi:hypothetical protein
MAPMTTSVRALAALAALSVASATLTCPPSNQMDTSCLCTSGCSINGDAVSFPWLAPTYPVPKVDLGKDTICVSIVVPCTTAAASLNAFLGITGNIQMDNVTRCGAAARGLCAQGVPRELTRVLLGAPAARRSNDIVGCQANAQVVMHTGFTEVECTNFATKYNALVAATPSASYSAPLLCTSNNCNGLVMTVHSSAGRVAASVATLVALAAAALL